MSPVHSEGQEERIEIRHERRFRFSVRHGERYFGYHWTFWGALRLASRAERILAGEPQR